MGWTKPDTATNVGVELTVTRTPSGDLSARALAIAVDANGEIVFKRGVGDDAVRAVLSASQKTALAGILETLHTEAATRLLT